MYTSTPTTAAIILAAGRSSRMQEGYHKLLLPLGEQSVVAHVVAVTLASQARPLIVVTGYRTDDIHTSLDAYTTSLTFIENPRFREGMSTSIRAGIRTLQALPTIDIIDGALIILGDQPLITSHMLDTLIDTKRRTGKRIITSLFNGKRMSPTLFDKSLFPELLEITGDEGGRAVLECHRSEIAKVEHGDESASIDVDTWEAYQQVVAEWEHSRGNREGYEK